jgi:hypothetical protein
VVEVEEVLNLEIQEEPQELVVEVLVVLVEQVQLEALDQQELLTLVAVVAVVVKDRVIRQGQAVPVVQVS